MIRARHILKGITEELVDMFNDDIPNSVTEANISLSPGLDIDSSESPQDILNFIRTYLKDVHNVEGDNKEVKFVLNNLIHASNNPEITDKLKKIRALLK